MRRRAQAYAAMREDPAFKAPLAWRQVRREDFDGLLLPGGHRARGMREYLESDVLQKLVARIFRGRPAGRGDLPWRPPGRAQPRPPTAIPSCSAAGPPRSPGRWSAAGWTVGRIVRFWDPNYYRTYEDGAGKPAGYMSVQQEVTRALARPQTFSTFPPTRPTTAARRAAWRATPGTTIAPAFVVRDGNYVSARWPGDAHTFARAFAGAAAKCGG